MQVLNKNQTIMRWLKHRGGAQHHARWGKEKTAPLPAAARDRRRSRHHPGGGDAGAGNPVGISVRRPAARASASNWPIACQQPLKVPAEAEIVIEGEVSLDRLSRRRPLWRSHRLLQFGGAVSRSSPSPRSPCGATRSIFRPIPARPPDEPSILGEALNEVFVPLLSQQFPEIVDFWLPPEGCSYRIAVVSMKKAYPGHAKRVMMAVWSYLRQFMYTKWVIVVDDDINARDWKDVMWAISTRMDPARDITLIENTPIDYLDFASPEVGPGLQDRAGRHQQAAARNPARMGPQDRDGRGRDPTRSPKNGRAWACPAAASRSGADPRRAAGRGGRARPRSPSPPRPIGAIPRASWPAAAPRSPSSPP